MGGNREEGRFGETIRALRQEKGVSLRKFAEQVGMSPTYLSKVERDDFPPPAEDKVKAIAKALDQDPDVLLALAGRVASDLPEIIKKHPREMASFLRVAKKLSPRDLDQITKDIEAKRKKRPSKPET